MVEKEGDWGTVDDLKNHRGIKIEKVLQYIDISILLNIGKV